MLSTSKPKLKSKVSPTPSTTQKGLSRSEKMWRDLNKTPATQATIKPKPSSKASKPEVKAPQPLHAVGAVVHGAYTGDKGCHITWYGKIVAVFKVPDHDYFEYVIRSLYHPGFGPALLGTYHVKSEGNIYSGLPGWVDASKMAEAQ